MKVPDQDRQTSELTRRFLSSPELATLIKGFVSEAYSQGFRDGVRAGIQRTRAHLLDALGRLDEDAVVESNRDGQRRQRPVRGSNSDALPGAEL